MEATLVAAAAGVYFLGKKAFGRELVDTGVQGTFNGAGTFAGTAYAFYKGGWFRGDKTTTSPLDEGVGAAFDAGAKAVAESARRYADALGLPGAVIDGFSQQVRFSLAGLNEQQTREKIVQAVAGFNEGLAGHFRALAQTFEHLAVAALRHG
ncbi:MAG: hypothetical protein J0L57_20975 [Burkholderiales bacterium]|nr:hypothetical protein [Burkholderiales bacterium]